MIRFIHSIVFIFCVFTLAAQNATVQGVVKDSYGNPIDAATVGVPGTTYGSTTEQDGSFKFNIPANQELKVIVRHISFEEYSTFINAKLGETIRLNITAKDKATNIKISSIN